MAVAQLVHHGAAVVEADARAGLVAPVPSLLGAETSPPGQRSELVAHSTRVKGLSVGCAGAGAPAVRDMPHAAPIPRRAGLVDLR